MKIQPMHWEKTSANEATDKGLIFKIYKHLIQLSKKKKQKTQTSQSKNGQMHK